MVELENFSFLIPGELAGMGYPESPGAIEELSAHGVRSLVSLSRRAPDAAALRGLVHLHCPLADFARIPPLDLHRAVVFLDRAPRPIAVHGEGGVGRTGVVLACRLVALGSEPAGAIAAVRRARPGSIDDPELEASVWDYARFFATARPGACFNFAPASPLDRIAHGAERPGLRPAGGAPGDPDGPPDSRLWINDDSDAPLEEWLGFMSRQGIREVICLLEAGRAAAYRPPLIERYRREFLRVTHLPMDDGRAPSMVALEQAIEALLRAEASGSPVVVHCAGGIGRTGVVLAAWLRARHGLRADAAIELVRAHARRFGATRDPLEAGEHVSSLIAGVRPLAAR